MASNHQERKEGIVITVTPTFARIALWCLAFTGFVLSSLSVASCRFIKVVTVQNTSGTFSVDILYVGAFRILSPSGICVPLKLYTSMSSSGGQSSSLKTTQAFGVLASVLGGLDIVSMLITILFTGVKRVVWITMASILIACTVFQLITFVAFNSPICTDTLTLSECSIDEGSAFAISAILFYSLASVGMFFVTGPKVPLIKFAPGWRGGTLASQGNESRVPNASRTSDGLTEKNIVPVDSPPGEFVSNVSSMHSGVPSSITNPMENEAYYSERGNSNKLEL